MSISRCVTHTKIRNLPNWPDGYLSDRLRCAIQSADAPRQATKIQTKERVYVCQQTKRCDSDQNYSHNWVNSFFDRPAGPNGSNCHLSARCASERRP